MCHSQHGDLYKSGQTGKAWQQIIIILKQEETQHQGQRRKGRLERLFVNCDGLEI